LSRIDTLLGRQHRDVVEEPFDVLEDDLGLTLSAATTITFAPGN
jgi:hypothetical protein